MTTFPSYFLWLFLKQAGWPRPKGLLVRRQVVSSTILRALVDYLIQTGIAFGARRPQLGVKLLADAFRQRDWSQQPPAEMWSDFDPSERIASKPNERPEEVIMGFNSLSPLSRGLKERIEWELVKTDSFSACYHAAFVRGLIWGIAHPEEAAARYEEQRQRYLKGAPGMVEAGLNVDASLIQTLDEFVDMMEEIVDAFQERTGPLGDIPIELSAFPPINTRIDQNR